MAEPRQGPSSSDALSRMTVYEAPPDSFDPHTAPPALLRRHGFPPRPDPETDPQRARIWARAFRRPVTYVTAQLAVDEVMPFGALMEIVDVGDPPGSSLAKPIIVAPTLALVAWEGFY